MLRRDVIAVRAESAQICRAGVARTFQICQLFDTMTVEENVLAAALYGSGVESLGIGEARRRTQLVLEKLGSDHRTNGVTAEVLKS